MKMRRTTPGPRRTKKYVDLDDGEAKPVLTESPVTYEPDFRETAIRVLQEGKTLAHLAGELKVTKGTLEAWCKMHPEFKQAVEIGLTLAEAKLLDLALEALDKRWNPQTWQTIMINAFGWIGAHQKTEQTIKEQSARVNVFHTLSPEKLEKIGLRLGLPEFKELVEKSKAIDVTPEHRDK